MKRIGITAMLLTAITLTNCYYDNEELLYGEEQCSNEPSTYSGTVSVIISNNCLVCHSASVASGGVTLETHSQVKTLADNGTLAGVISHSSGFPPMPKNAPQLSQCNINAIIEWIDGGALNN